MQAGVAKLLVIISLIKVMKKKLIGFGSMVAGFATPLLALAQTNPDQGNTAGCNSVDPGTIQAIICNIGNILDILIPILIILGVVYFVWGVVTYVISSDEEAKKAGKDRMIFGIIGLVVIVAMWGLVGIVTKTFGLSGTTDYTIPTVPFNSLQ